MDSALGFSIAFLESQPLGAARVLDAIDSGEAAAFLKDAPTPAIVGVLGHMQPARSAAVLQEMPAKRTAELLLQLPASTRSVLLRALPENTVGSVLSAVTSRQRAAIRRYLAYSPGSVGAWMNAPKLTLLSDATVADAIGQVRNLGERPGGYVFVTDVDRCLRGAVAVDQLLYESDKSRLKDIMHRDISRLSPQAPLSSVISLPDWDTSLLLPVVDQAQHLIGVLAFENLRNGLITDRAPATPLPINRIVAQIAEAYLVCLSGLLETTRTSSDLNRLADREEVGNG